MCVHIRIVSRVESLGIIMIMIIIIIVGRGKHLSDRWICVRRWDEPPCALIVPQAITSTVAAEPLLGAEDIRSLIKLQ